MQQYKNKKKREKTVKIRESTINPVSNYSEKKSPDDMSKNSHNKDSDQARIGSTAGSRVNSIETPNPLRDQTPSQMTSKKSQSPEVVKEPPKPKKITFPMENKDLLEFHPKFLSSFEQKEVLKYPEVYFLNVLERKLNGGPEKLSGTHNHGYDNDQGEYQYVIHDHIAYRFEIMRKLGKGSFGVVLK
jgi:dual specificity tyrosine-phosphorylation-regulated kinase 2/3/4